jgi:predicted transcriptional regulator
VKDLTYTPLIMLDSDESIVHAFKIMKRKGMKKVSVVKNGQLVGMLTDGLANKTGVRVKTRVHKNKSFSV